MRRLDLFRLSSFLFVFVFCLASVTPVLAVTAESNCTSTNGTWNGDTSSTGTCTYGPKESITISSCGSSRYKYILTYVGGVETNADCKPLSGGGYTAVTSDGAQSGSLTLHLKNEMGYVTFPNGCPQNCTINSTLPDPAKASLNETPMATLYVRTGSNSVEYTVCFTNLHHTSLSVYRNIGGIWLPLVQAATGNPVCVSASGDGSFYLG